MSSSLKAAQLYVSLEFGVIPIPPGTKHPSRNEWQHLRLKAADLPRYFPEGSNLGVLDGHNGLADIDLDCQESIAAGAELLPPTKMIFGRKSKPRSHYVYRTDPALREKNYLDPLNKKKGFVQLRGLKHDGTIGHQTMVPPSINPEGGGEPVRFEPDCGPWPANLDADEADELDRTVALVAAAALLGRQWPGERNGRNPAFLVLAGAGARAGWTVEETVRFHCAIYRVLWGSQADLEQARREVCSTYKKHREGLSITGKSGLTELID